MKSLVSGALLTKRFIRVKTRRHMFMAVLRAVGGAVSPIARPTVAGAYNNKIAMGGFGGSARIPVTKKIDLGVKAMYGPGVGRYGNSTLPDVTANAARVNSRRSTDSRDWEHWNGM